LILILFIMLFVAYSIDNPIKFDLHDKANNSNEKG
jgi:hypothetical protein